MEGVRGEIGIGRCGGKERINRERIARREGEEDLGKG